MAEIVVLLVVRGGHVNAVDRRVSAVTVNCADGGPEASAAASRAGMDAWLGVVLAQPESRWPSLVFAQETRGPWLERWQEAGYHVVTASPRYRPVSAVITRLEVVGDRPASIPTQGYHGSYLVGLHVLLPGDTAPLLAVSVHASPRVVDEHNLEIWDSLAARPRPRVGAGAGAGAGRLFDADMVLATLAECALQGSVLAAGDFNEARDWDDSHPGEWGRDFFERARKHRLQSPLFELWGEERTTRFNPRGRSYQLDHLLATREVAALVTEAWVDDRWDDAESRHGRSDHAPVWFALDPAVR